MTMPIDKTMFNYVAQLDGPGRELATDLKATLLLSAALTRALTTADSDATIRATLPAALRPAYDACVARLRGAP